MNNNQRKPCILVIGRGSDESEKILVISEHVGRLIAEQGMILCSGGGSGVMEAASRGAQQAGGLTIGFLSGHHDFEIEREANPYLNIQIRTGMGNEVSSAVAIRSCDGVIVIGGANGTLGEMSNAYLRKKPLVLLAQSGGWSDRIRKVLIDGVYLDERKNIPLRSATTPEEAVNLVIDLISKKTTRGIN